MRPRRAAVTIRRTMGASYAVVWREPGGPTCSGAVEAGVDAITFRGAAAGEAVERVVPFSGLAGVRTLRTGAELIDGRTTLLLELAEGSRLSVAAVAGVGALAELAAVLASRTARR